jgi:uncharacterized membrane protein HdeD (DUF308 family)
MRYELKLHRLTLGILACILAIFVALLLEMGQTVADEHLEVITSFIVLVLAATAFGFMGMVEGIVALQFGKKHRRELLSYLSLGLISLGCGLYLAISNTARVQTVALVAAPHAFLFGIGQLRLAWHLERHKAYQEGLIVGGLIEILAGLALIRGYHLSTEGTVTLLACVAIISILQLLPLVLYRHKRNN